VEEVKIHSGTRVKLKKFNESLLDPAFVSKLQEYALHDQRIEAIYLFAIQSEGHEEQLSMAIAISVGMFKKVDEEFLSVVDEIQLLLPPDLSVNLYRLMGTPLIDRYCLEELDPLYLKSAAWRDKQLKKLRKAQQ
jgi:hypothetical protein